MRATLVGLLLPHVLLAHSGHLGDHVVEAVRLDATPAPRIDGHLDDEVWLQAQPLTGLRQLVPDRGAPTADDSEVRLAYDEHNLYIGVRCYDDPEHIINRIARRGDIWPSDWISFYIDSQHDHRTGYKFSTTPGGLQQDEFRFDDTDTDRNWRGIWWVEAAVDERGWTAEFKIPFANFRFQDTAQQVWGFDVERRSKRTTELTVWKQMTQAGQRTRMSDLGHIVGLRGISSGKPLEVTPYVLSGASESHGTSLDGQGGVGLDLQYNLAAAVKANLTVNPDFAQVEADEVEINLTRFPTRFDERRPFFVEGNSFFDTPLDLFFSRRVGSRGDILWGSKVTGKVGDYSVGFLGSQTRAGDLLDIGSDSPLREEAFYSALRLKRDVSRRSHVGLLYAGKETDAGHSRVGGLDASLALDARTDFSGQYAASFAPGSDADNTAISGGLGRRDHLWDIELEFERVAPRFETNETGFLNKERYRGWQRLGYWASYRPRWGRHEIEVGSSAELGRSLYDDTYFDNWRSQHPDLVLAPDFEEDLLAWEAFAWAGMGLTESTVGTFTVFYGRTREIELTDVFQANTLGLSVESNEARPVSVGIDVDMGDFYNFARRAPGTQRSLSLFGTVRPRTNLAIEIDAGLARTLDRNDEVDGRFSVGSARATYLFTRDTFLRIFTQAEGQRLGVDETQRDSSYLFSALFGWEYSPKSHFFVAYNESWGGPAGDLRLGDRVVLLKLSYLANL